MIVWRELTIIDYHAPFDQGFRRFPRFALRIPYCARFLRHQRAHMSARAYKTLRDFPQTKLDSEIKAPFLLNEHGDPHSLFYIFNENNIRNN